MLYFEPLAALFVLFFGFFITDTQYSLAQMLKNIIRSLKFIVYNLPFILISQLFLGIIEIIHVIVIILLIILLTALLIVMKNFIPAVMGDSLSVIYFILQGIIGLFFVSGGIVWFHTFYLQKAHEHFDLYFS
jgi:hypothetical protein